MLCKSGQCQGSSSFSGCVDAMMFEQHKNVSVSTQLPGLIDGDIFLPIFWESESVSLFRLYDIDVCWESLWW